MAQWGFRDASVLCSVSMVGSLSIIPVGGVPLDDLDYFLLLGTVCSSVLKSLWGAFCMRFGGF